MKKILYPPIWLILLLIAGCILALVMIFLNALEESPIAYIVYVLSFYTLTVTCIYSIKVLPKRYRQIKDKIYQNKYGNRYLTDIVFKTRVLLNASLIVNQLYVGANILSYVLYRSMWFVILAVYYVILSVMRFLLLHFVQKGKLGKDKLAEWKMTRICSIILLLINFVLTGAVLMILYQDKGYEYHGIMIYIMALYTFYSTIHAITDMVKYRKYNSPVMMTTKIISLSAALVSMLALETAMFAQFGAEMVLKDQKIMVAATGAGVSFVVIGLSSYMIARSVNEVRKQRRNKNGNF